MSFPDGDKLASMLEDGWTVAGYSVCMMVGGALAHNVLLQKGSNLKSLTIGTNNGVEIGRSTFDFAPQAAPPLKKKGLFG
jgi:hypothetical protein